MSRPPHHSHHHARASHVDACQAAKYAPALAFVTANRLAAEQIAKQLATTAENLLGLSGVESGWGTGPLITAGTNNYFSLTVGPAFLGTTGQYRQGSYTFGIYPDPGFLKSGLSYAASYFGARVRGVTDPDAFAQAMNAKGSFNSEKLATPYDHTIASAIRLAATLSACAVPSVTP